MKRWALLILVFAVWLVGDLGTKEWADVSLADPHHPLPVLVGEGDAGRPVRELVSEQLGLEGAALEAALRHVSRLPPQEAVDPSAPAFPAGGDRVRGYFVDWRHADGMPPRRIDKRERALIYRWAQWAAPSTDAKALREAVDARLADTTMSQWLGKHLRRLEEDEVRDVLAHHTHPIRGALTGVAGDSPAEADATYLIEWRRLDVHGDWFKLLYAENPGAAFGFLKNVPAKTRDRIFFGLTLVVLLVITLILVRIPRRHVLAPLALVSVLGGAAGNFVDRIRFGYVIDFIDMHLGFMRWPTYNIADIAISVGVILMLLDMTFNPDSPLAAARPEEDTAEGEDGGGARADEATQGEAAATEDQPSATQAA